MRIKDLKEQPLLELPEFGVRSWVRVRPSDIEAMQRSLDANRKAGFGNSIASLAYEMSELGVNPHLTQGDVDLMKGGLDVFRKNKGGLGLAETHHAMRCLGFPQEITGEDREMIENDLTESQSDGGALRRFGLLACASRLLGRREPTDEDIKKIRRDLEAARSLADGMEIATHQYYMKQLNLGYTIREGDMEAYKKALTEERSRRRGEMIARMLFLLAKVLPEEERL